MPSVQAVSPQAVCGHRSRGVELGEVAHTIIQPNAWGPCARGRVASPVMTRYVPHHADLLRERRPHLGHALHDDRRRRARPLAPAARRRRPLPHRHRRARPQDRRRPPRPPAVTPQEFADEIAPHFQDAWERLNIANDDFIRTTEHRHNAAVQPSCCSAATTPATSSSTSTRASTAWPCEEYYTEDELLQATCARIHKRPVEYFEEENYFFRLCRFQDRLLDWYAAHPDAIVPEHRGNEALGLIRGGLRDFSVSRTVAEVGHPAAVGPEARRLRVVRRAHQLHHRRRLRHDDHERFAQWWPVDTTSSARTSSATTACTGRRCCMSAGIEPPAGWAVGGWLLVGRREDEQDLAATWSTRSTSSPTFGVDGFRYYVLAETPYGHDGDFTYEGIIARYNATSPTTSATCSSRVATVVGKKCGGVGPRPRADSPLAEAAADACDATARRGPSVQPTEALDATWSLIRATNAYLETNEPWKAEPGPAVDAVMGDALEALRIVALLASPAIPHDRQTIWERIGLTGRIDRPAAARGRGVGRLPRRAAGHEGRPAVPPQVTRRGADDAAASTTTATSTTTASPGGTAGALRAARAAG